MPNDHTTHPAAWKFMGEEDRFDEFGFLGTWMVYVDQDEVFHYVRQETDDAQ